MKDSANGKRYRCRVKKTGRIIKACGFDLPPVAASHAELVRLAEKGRTKRAAMGCSATPGDVRAQGHCPDLQSISISRFVWGGMD